MTAPKIVSRRSVIYLTSAGLLAVGLAGCRGEDEPVRGAGSIHVPRPSKTAVPDSVRKQYNLPDGKTSTSG